MGELIVCRAQTSKSCLHAEPVERQIPMEEGFPPPTMADDGTDDGESIVCDPCYVGLMAFTPSGRGLIHELDDAIKEAKHRARSA